jgi:hypothetical protein
MRRIAGIIMIILGVTTMGIFYYWWGLLPQEKILDSMFHFKPSARFFCESIMGLVSWSLNLPFHRWGDYPTNICLSQEKRVARSIGLTG